MHILGHLEFLSMPNLLFSFESLLHKNFAQTDLGELYQSIPFDSFAQTIPAPAFAKSNLGRKPWFDVKGGIGLLILKHYTGLSDALLIERINTDWAMQLFCGILLKPGEQIKDTNQPSFWRTYIGQHLDIDKLQKRTAAYWKPWMQQHSIGMQDATCYESRISFPTDVKLLWQCCNAVYILLQQVRKQNKQRCSRINYDKKKKEFLSYQRTKKKTRRAEKKLRIKLVKFLLKLLQQLEHLQTKYNTTLSHKEQKQLRTVITVYNQQHGKLYGDTAIIKDRIVSLSKAYIRPIVRGKEVKQVEFGAKVNVLQVDGINFIEHLS